MLAEHTAHPLPDLLVRMHQGRDLGHRVMASAQV
jgi:hypothetical protein